VNSEGVVCWLVGKAGVVCWLVNSEGVVCWLVGIEGVAGSIVDVEKTAKGADWELGISNGATAGVSGGSDISFKA